MSAVIDISLSHTTQNGARYSVYVDDSLLLKSSRDPEHDAARALAKMGVTGRLQWRWNGSQAIAGEGLIAVMATRTTSETKDHGPRLVKWSEHWISDAQVADEEAA